MKLDTNRAWESGMRFVGANKSLLLVLAGAFLFLPTAIFGLAFPQPPIPENATMEQAQALQYAWLADVWPYLVIMWLVTTLGSLAIYILAIRRDGGTVQDALSSAARLIPWFLLVQIVLIVAIGVVLGIAIALIVIVASMIVGPGVALVLTAALMAVGMFYLAVKSILIAPVLVAEGTRNPIEIIRRSFRLTKGNSLRIFVFLALLIAAALVLLLVTQGILGLIFVLVAGAETAASLGAISYALVTTAFSVILIGCIAAIYRQLAAPPESGAGIPSTAE